jgi:predicted component of type VI protein secretion system
MIGGQQISRPADPKASPAEIQQDDQGRFIAIDRATGVARVVTDQESGSPVMAKPKLTTGSAEMASMIQNEISSNAAKYQMLSQFSDDTKVVWDSNSLTYTPAGLWGGKTAKAEKERLFKDTESRQKRLDALINPTAKPASLTAEPTPAASPTPAPFASPDEVRAAVRSGQLTRDAALEILRSQFNYK